MAPKISRKLLVEHVGVTADSAESRALAESIRVQLAAYPERREVLDGRPSVRLRQIERLRDALKEADRGARFLIGGVTTDTGGMLRPEIDLAVLEASIEEAISGLQMEMKGSSTKQRATEVARDYTARELACLFKEHYRLEPKEYAKHLDAFLRALFHANLIAYPDPIDSKQHGAFLRKHRLI